MDNEMLMKIVADLDSIKTALFLIIKALVFILIFIGVIIFELGLILGRLNERDHG